LYGSTTTICRRHLSPPEKAVAAVILHCSAMGVMPRLAGSDKSYVAAILLQLCRCVHGLYQLQAHGKGTNMAHLAARAAARYCLAILIPACGCRAPVDLKFCSQSFQTFSLQRPEVRNRLARTNGCAQLSMYHARVIRKNIAVKRVHLPVTPFALLQGHR
jgi:hypothetical protein